MLSSAEHFMQSHITHAKKNSSSLSLKKNQTTFCYVAQGEILDIFLKDCKYLIKEYVKIDHIFVATYIEIICKITINKAAKHIFLIDRIL